MNLFTVIFLGLVVYRYPLSGLHGFSPGEGLHYVVDLEHQDRQKRLANSGRCRDIPTAGTYAGHARSLNQVCALNQ